jgi:MFS family permease
MSFFSFLRENFRWVFAGFLLCLFSAFGQTYFIALSGGEIRAEYGLSNGEFGGLYMGATLASAMVLPFVGRIVDYLSVSRTVAITVPMLALACILMATSSSIVMLGLTLFLLRLFGQGMMTHISLTAMGRWFTGQRGRAVSLATLGMQAGEGSFPILMVSLFALLGWRHSWLASAATLMIVALPAIFFLMREERQPRSTDMPERRSAARHWTRGEVLRDPLFWLSVTGVLAPAFIGTTIFFHQAWLVEIRGWEPQAFASAFTLLAAMTICFVLVGGQLIDTFGATSLLPGFLLPLAAGCFVLAFFDSEWGIFAFMALMGVGYGLSSTLFGALWPEVYGTEHLGSVRSFIVALMVLSSALGPGITGWLIDLGVYYPHQIGVMGLYCLAASAIMLFVSRRFAARAAA